MSKADLPKVGPWAADKLQRLGKYLAAYTTIMAKQKWAEGFIFVDAFAGAGRAVVRSPKPAKAPPNVLLDFETPTRSGTKTWSVSSMDLPLWLSQ